MTQELLKQALEMLECLKRDFDADQFEWEIADEAIIALQKALAQLNYRAVKTYHEGEPVYVAQPEQEPVAYGMWDTMLGYGGRMMMVRLDKGQDGCTIPLYTTPPHPHQKQNLNCKSTQARLATAWGYTKVLDISDKRLMKMPPQREWAGLTDEEALECWPGLAMYADCVKFWENIEAKLKEKNGAHIHRNGKQVYLGLFATAEMAHQAYKENQ